MTLPRLGAVGALLSALVACGGPPAPTPAAPKHVADAEPAPQLGDVDPAQLAAEADKKAALVPSPLETQAALGAAGLDTALGTLVPASRSFSDGSDPDRVAVRAGVVMADLLLTVKTSSNERLLAQLGTIRGAMADLGGGKDIDATLVDLTERVTAGALDRDQLLGEFDEIASVAIPELEFNGVSRIVPLIQAGAWLEGAHLVAQALKASTTPAAGDGILKQPAVVAYFADYARQRGDDELSSEVAGALDGALGRLADVAGKDASLTAEDLDVVIGATGAVLALL